MKNIISKQNKKFKVIAVSFLTLVLSLGFCVDNTSGFFGIRAFGNPIQIRFCTNTWQPFWGVCQPGSGGFDCYKLAYGSSGADCDGTWIMEIW